jgi:UDP-N-acetylglucosamine enolpyruvyl transferase
MNLLGNKFSSQSDKKYVCSFLYTIENEDVVFNNKIKSTLKLLIKLFIETGVLWHTSDNRIKLTSKGASVLQILLATFVDFEPKAVKFQYTRYE